MDAEAVPEDAGGRDERNRVVMWLKACPKCRGDLLLDSDYYGHYVSCTRCGAMLDWSRHGKVERDLFAEEVPAELMEMPGRPSDRKRVA